MLDEFLEQVRAAMKSRRFVMIPRRKNLQTLADYGLTSREVFRVIQSLSAKNYVKGPLPDHNGDLSPVWIFETKIGNVRFYVKLKFDPEVGVKCISFHD